MIGDSLFGVPQRVLLSGQICDVKGEVYWEICVELQRCVWRYETTWKTRPIHWEGKKKVYLKMDYPHSSAIFWEKGGFKLRTTGFVWNLCTLESIGNTYYYPHYFKAMRYTMIYPNFRHIQLDLVAEDRHDQRPLAAHHAEVSGCIFLGSPIGEPW
jgi:hypothetical protein